MAQPTEHLEYRHSSDDALRAILFGVEVPLHFGQLAGAVGKKRAGQLLAAFELGRRSALPRVRPAILSPNDVYAWAKRCLSGLAHEELWLFALDARMHLLSARRVASGSTDALTVRTRDVLRIALCEGASSMVLVHNHPSGSLEASPADRVFTNAVGAAARTIGLPLLDHVVVTEEGYCSIMPDPAI
jgi:DNA repair protein RadC